MAARFGVAVSCTILALAGCFQDSTKPKTEDPEDGSLPQTTIANVIFNLKLAYTSMNSEMYGRLFDDGFVFAFAPEDVGGNNNIPATWGKTDELASAGKMMRHEPNRDHYVAQGITLAFVAGAEQAAPSNPEWRMVELLQIQLNVDSANAQGEQLIYEVIGDKEILLFAPSITGTGSGARTIWKIVRWEDHNIGGVLAGTRSSSWGSIKANWR